MSLSLTYSKTFKYMNQNRGSFTTYWIFSRMEVFGHFRRYKILTNKKPGKCPETCTSKNVQRLTCRLCCKPCLQTAELSLNQSQCPDFYFIQSPLRIWVRYTHTYISESYICICDNIHKSGKVSSQKLNNFFFLFNSG